MKVERDHEVEGATTALEYDRIAVQRFRESFPRARWDDQRQVWFVPGKTAEHRIARWHALEAAKADIHADAKGRDAYQFEPIESAYLEAGLNLVVRTPYSRTVIDELRQVPFARWDAADRMWVVPFRSYDDLRQRWPTIEAAARRNEPEARQRRRAEAKGTEAFLASQKRSAERRKFRYPVPLNDLPPLDRPVSTPTYGIIVMTGSHGELVGGDTAGEFYAEVAADRELIWASWRPATLEELVKTWPARAEPEPAERARGWWQPTKPELVTARKAARAIERRRQNGRS
jgi:hypothetical protein